MFIAMKSHEENLPAWAPHRKAGAEVLNFECTSVSPGGLLKTQVAGPPAGNIKVLQLAN